MNKKIIYTSEQGLLQAVAENSESSDFIIYNNYTGHQLGIFDADGKRFRPTHTDSSLSINLLKDMVDLFEGVAKKFEDDNEG